MKIVLVEDDYQQSNFMSEEFRRRFGEATEVKIVKTELAFRDQLDEIRSMPPDIFIIDVKLNWTMPSPNMKIAPPEFLDKNQEPPGYRCQRLLEEHGSTQGVPVILCSVFHESNWDVHRPLPATVSYVAKGDLEAIFDEVLRLTGKTP